MKKYFFFAVAALLSMAACTNISLKDETPETPVRFAVINHLQQTKAQTLPYGGMTYPTGVPFGTFAWWTQNAWTGIAADQDYVFMDNVKVAYNSGTWAPVSTYYWTKSGYITFASYSPYTADGTDNGYSALPAYNAANGFIFNDYTIVDATNVDLMYADLAANCTQQTNENGSQVTDEGDSGFKGVPTIFNHALCQINFAFRAIGFMNPNVDRIQIDVQDVDIVNITNKSTFTQNNTPKWADNRAAAALTDYDFAPASTLELPMLDASDPAVVSATDNSTDLGVSRIILPQTLLNSADAISTTSDQMLVVTYTIKMHYTTAPADESDPKYWATESIVSKVRLYNGTITSWLDNQNITYRISINPYVGQAITFDPAVAPWTDVYSTDVNLREND